MYSKVESCLGACGKVRKAKVKMQWITRMSMEVIVTIVSKLGYFTYLRDVSNLPL